MDLGTLFQGIGTLFLVEPKIAIARILLIFLGIVLVFLGKKGTLEPLIMIPMGFGMAAVNAGMLVLPGDIIGTIFMDSLAGTQDVAGADITSTPAGAAALFDALQIDFLQPIYTFMFSNGLIACLVFMGIGVISDIGNVLRFPFTSMLIAMFAELGSVLTFPIARAMGLDLGAAAAISIVGGADGPMVLYSSLMLAPELFVPITIIAYLYLSLCYGGYPFLIRLMIPKNLRGQVVKTAQADITSKEKIIFDVVAGTLLCLLFPVAAPLFLSFFLGNAIKESGVTKYAELLENVFLYASTFLLGLLLGILCDAATLLNPEILPLLVLGILALLISGIGGIIGGYVVWLINGKKFNPVIGIAGVSCVPSTAKVAQKEAAKANKRCTILQYAMGASICGVITTAILTGLYIAVLKPLI
ncbi:MAG: sodium ion-translocating decarboxylase subunit beta [Clostridiales Family XIII bacterium]|jgi:oxaloacetate decarboxylase beta subunit|nr:sodium ion-translocating decarboxylase subunit beta [Clostridiales Family XIII bacterium]